MADKFEFTPRTCEEYVLNQLMEAKTELEELAEKSKDLAVESFANAIQLAALKIPEGQDRLAYGRSKREELPLHHQ